MGGVAVAAVEGVAGAAEGGVTTTSGVAAEAAP